MKSPDTIERARCTPFKMPLIIDRSQPNASKSKKFACGTNTLPPVFKPSPRVFFVANNVPYRVSGTLIQGTYRILQTLQLTHMRYEQSEVLGVIKKEGHFPW